MDARRLLHAMSYERESLIGSAKAREILRSLGRGDEWTEGSDYYLAWDAEGREYLTEWGQDRPIAENAGTTSWASPDFP
jgi:hypothetical protein